MHFIDFKQISWRKIIIISHILLYTDTHSILIDVYNVHPSILIYKYITKKISDLNYAVLHQAICCYITSKQIHISCLHYVVSICPIVRVCVCVIDYCLCACDNFMGLCCCVLGSFVLAYVRIINVREGTSWWQLINKKRPIQYISYSLINFPTQSNMILRPNTSIAPTNIIIYALFGNKLSSAVHIMCAIIMLMNIGMGLIATLVILNVGILDTSIYRHAIARLIVRWLGLKLDGDRRVCFNVCNRCSVITKCYIRMWIAPTITILLK